MYENDIVRYCETEAAKTLNCLSPSTSVNVTCVPPNRSPPLVTPSATGGRPSRNSFSNAPFLRLFAATIVCVIGGWTSTGGPGVASPKSADATVWSGSSRGKR
jgi:hypothetical protein